jgi:hypothetical protein
MRPQNEVYYTCCAGAATVFRNSFIFHPPSIAIYQMREDSKNDIFENEEDLDCSFYQEVKKNYDSLHKILKKEEIKPSKKINVVQTIIVQTNIVQTINELERVVSVWVCQLHKLYSYLNSNEFTNFYELKQIQKDLKEVEEYDDNQFFAAYRYYLDLRIKNDKLYKMLEIYENVYKNMYTFLNVKKKIMIKININKDILENIDNLIKVIKIFSPRAKQTKELQSLYAKKTVLSDIDRRKRELAKKYSKLQ